MDYGQSGQNGVKTEVENTGNFEPNVDLSNEISPSQPGERESRIGNQAMNFPETGDFQEEIAPGNPEYGQIIEMTPPPGVEISQEQPETESFQDDLNKNAFKTGSKLNPAAIKEIDFAKRKLDQTGDAADFYDKARDAMESNLSNSYDRKLAA